MPAGYSGTPLPKKLGIKDGFRISMHKLPADVKAELKEALNACKASKSGPFDYVHLFVKTQADMKRDFSHLQKELAPAGMLWVSWPKKASGVTTDLDENIIRKLGLDAGLVDVKVCAVSEVWSGLKFVIRLKDRKSS
jgi:hypothetical protein